MKQTITILLLTFLTLITAVFQPVQAEEHEADGAAQLVERSTGAVKNDNRAKRLRAYLASHNSPMTEVAGAFVEEADLNGLDWKFVAAIAGTESTFGKHVPAGSYNGWGWGIPTGAQSGIAFKNWQDGIQTVSRGLRNRYMDRGAKTIEQVGTIYAASPRWAGNVRFFMQKIEGFLPTDPEYIELSI